MRSTSLSFDASMAAGERPIPVVFFTNAFGVRVWSTQHPTKLADAEGDEHLADGTWKADGTIKAGVGLGSILDRSARVIEIGTLEEGNPDAAFDDAQRETDPTALTVVISNDDQACSRIEAEENILSARVRLDVIQPGSTDWDDRLTLGDFMVIEYVMTRERLELVCREI